MGKGRKASERAGGEISQGVGGEGERQIAGQSVVQSCGTHELEGEKEGGDNHRMRVRREAQRLLQLLQEHEPRQQQRQGWRGARDFLFSGAITECEGYPGGYDDEQCGHGGARGARAGGAGKEGGDGEERGDGAEGAAAAVSSADARGDEQHALHLARRLALSSPQSLPPFPLPNLSLAFTEASSTGCHSYRGRDGLRKDTWELTGKGRTRLAQPQGALGLARALAVLGLSDDQDAAAADGPAAPSTLAAWHLQRDRNYLADLQEEVRDIQYSTCERSGCTPGA